MIGLALAFLLMVLHPDLDLVRRALAEEGPSRQMLVRRLTPVIWAHVRRALIRTRSLATFAPDLTQHIWLRLWADDGRLLRRFDPEKASLEHYVGRIVTRSEVRDWVRSRGAAKHGGDATFVDFDQGRRVAGTDRPDQRVADVDLAKRVFSHLNSALSGRGRVVFKMIYEDQMSVAGIASALGVEAHVVHNWQARIRKQARGFLATLEA